MAKENFSNVFNCTDSCALTGAAAFFTGIPQAYMVANGPLWCYFYALRYLERADYRVEKRFVGTQPDNTAVVYGTEECLLNTLQMIKDTEQPSIVLVENSCAVGLIGDDIEGIARKAELPCPVVCFDSGGLLGGYCKGFSIAAKNFFESFPLKERQIIKPKKVNLLGMGIGYLNAENDLAELKLLLSTAGLEIGACPGAGSSLDEIATMNDAALNIVIHAELGLEQAVLLESKYGIPYFESGVPYGITGTKKWLQNLSTYVPVQMELINEWASMIEHKNAARINDIKSTWGDLWFEQALIAAPSSVALGLAEALRLEWADMNQLVVILQDVPQVAFNQPEWIDKLLTAESPGVELDNALQALADGILLASSSETALVQKKGLKNVITCNIANPVHDELIITREPFMGFNGSTNMLQRIWNQKINDRIKSTCFS
ncbi:MAG TPA: nitrogenase component 1 [Candidatus Avacidaminococcus intestinavium]|uniref:Nitrogenase component 1 n=1 Tax=Candidatus Avacidaminococcus intestinavium TaxID=2840684 RepID=A0A9D1SK90_9FIRM|nr:nitrogenase component 1 [Candidatus Avacidaminococcus intestinavium]